MNQIKIILLLLLAAFSLSAAGAFGQEPIHPSGLNLDCRYTVSDSSIALGDTLTIIRTLTNNESYPLTGIYLTDNLPSVFSVVASAVTINGSPVPYLTDGPTPNTALPGYNDYRWTVDSPDTSEQISRQLNPGQQLIVTYRVVSIDIGNFALPLHATVMYGNSSGIFASDLSDTVHVYIALGVDDPEDSPLPRSFQLVSAYPNPFNAEVSIAYKGTGLTSQPIRLEIYNLTGQLVAGQSAKAYSDEGILHWAPDQNTGSGIYLYRLTIGEAKAGGKLVLMK